MASSDALSDVIISDRLSDRNERRLLGTIGLQVSWELSHAGMLTFDVPLTDLIKAGLDARTLLGKWIRYAHPTAGPWGGLITQVAPSDGIVGVTAESWAAALRGSVTPGVRTAGDIIRGLKLAIESVYPETGIRFGSALTDERHVQADLSFFERGQDIYEQFLPAVMDEWYAAFGGREITLQAAGWNVDPASRNFRFDASYGTDNSATVSLADGVHNTYSEWSEDLADIGNVVYLTAEANYRYSQTRMVRRRRGKKPKTVTVTDVAEFTAIGTNLTSVRQHGSRVVILHEDTLYPSTSALSQAALERALFLSRPQRLVRIDCADVDGVWATFREGDIITADLSNNGVKGPMVVRNRFLDTTSGVMTVSGESEVV
jgi:hypothetical protein